MLISFRAQCKQTDSFLAKCLTCQPERERDGERERERGTGERKGGIVGGGGDALGDFASVLCTAIVHQSLLEAKPVRTEQRFLRDLSLSAGMPKRKFNPRGRERWMDGHPWPSTVVPSSQDGSKRLREYLTSNVSCITAPKLILFSKALETAIVYSYSDNSSLAKKQQTNLQTDNHNRTITSSLIRRLSQFLLQIKQFCWPPVKPVTTSGIRSAPILWKCMKIKTHIFRGRLPGDSRNTTWCLEK